MRVPALQSTMPILNVPQRAAAAAGGGGGGKPATVSRPPGDEQEDDELIFVSAEPGTSLEGNK